MVEREAFNLKAAGSTPALGFKHHSAEEARKAHNLENNNNSLANYPALYEYKNKRKSYDGQFIPLLYKRTNLINNEPLKETLRRLVGKLLGGESKLSLPQLKLRKDTNIPLSIGLKTAKFMNGIHAAQAFIVDSIKYSPTPLNQFLVGMGTLVSRGGIKYFTFFPQC
ncbi:hypothetical protein BB561_006766 [Smittium simulii]|uniref:Uncharacterized protein n=1 Tax=Smittium simulii TaxID=133385 RepID=A0A2T9Y1U2_9FUNG|nr:hypothetical protein BB561_006766 [Smittium simulii]